MILVFIIGNSHMIPVSY